MWKKYVLSEKIFSSYTTIDIITIVLLDSSLRSEWQTLILENSAARLFLVPHFLCGSDAKLSVPVVLKT